MMCAARNLKTGDIIIAGSLRGLVNGMAEVECRSTDSVMAPIPDKPLWVCVPTQTLQLIMR